MEKELEAYLKADRQWLRPLRIAHAQQKLRGATDPKQVELLKLVLEANGVNA